MRVLMQPRPNIFSAPGGDTVQLEQTKKALHELGIQVNVSCELTPDVSGYDIIHLFNTTQYSILWTYAHFQNAKQAGKPIVTSSVYWPWNKNEERQMAILLWGKLRGKWLPAFRGTIRGYRPNWLRHAFPLLFMSSSERTVRRTSPEVYEAHCHLGIEGLQTQVWGGSDMLLPNSQAEINIIAQRIGAMPNYIVIPNGADLSFAEAQPDWFVNEYGLSDFVVCAANINTRKNQHSVIRALDGTDLVLVLIGAEEKRYALYCRNLARRNSNIVFLERLPQPKLASAYAAARVHVLASYYETPGLVSLEAALAGCNIVSTSRGCTREYLADMVWYCEPTDEGSIRDAVVAAYQAPYRQDLKEHILNNFTWQKAGQCTLEAYQRALD